MDRNRTFVLLNEDTFSWRFGNGIRNILCAFENVIPFFRSFTVPATSISLCGVTQIRLSAADEYFCAFRKFNGDGAVPPLFMATGRCCRPYTSPSCLVLYLLSLSSYHSRRLPPLLPLHTPVTFPFRVLRQDTAATDNIYYKTWPSMLAYHACVLYSEQSEKRNSQSDKSMVDRRTHQRCHFVPLSNSTSGIFYLVIANV